MGTVQHFKSGTKLGNPPIFTGLMQRFKDGGGGRIRTFEGEASRFTVCPRWPLGYPTTENTIPTVSLQFTRLSRKRERVVTISAGGDDQEPNPQNWRSDV